MECVDLSSKRMDIPDCVSWLLGPNSSFQILSIPFSRLTHLANFMLGSSNGRHRQQVPVCEKEINHFYWQQQGCAAGLDCLCYKLHKPGGGFSNIGSKQPLLGSSQGMVAASHSLGYSCLLCLLLALPAVFNQFPTLQPSLLEIYTAVSTLLFGHRVLQRSFCIRTKSASSFSSLKKEKRNASYLYKKTQIMDT